MCAPTLFPKCPADEEQITQVCEMLLNDGVEAYKKEGNKFIQRLVAKQKTSVKDSFQERLRIHQSEVKCTGASCSCPHVSSIPPD